MMPVTLPGGSANIRSPLGLPIRRMSSPEQQQLRARMRAPGPTVSRVLAVLAGLGAVVLAGSFFLGTPYDPNAFPVEVFVLGLLAVGFAGASSGMVRDPRAALERGEVVDLVGTAVSGNPSSIGMTSVLIGPVGLQLPPAAAKALVPGAPHQLALAIGLRPMKRAGSQLRRDRALLLSVNGVALAKPPSVFYAASGIAPTSTPTPPPLILSTTPAAGPSTPPSGGPAFCAQCGQPNTEPFRFCRRCGAPRSPAGTVP
ncbi:MAG: hypothetical protein ACLPWO_08365 [Thermoplasmata archaeon]